MSTETSTQGLDRLPTAALAAALLVATLPLLGLVYVAHRLLERGAGPFLYRGVRLGRDRRPFVIYKLRTLPLGTEERLGGALYVPDGRVESRFCGFLRRTHLDELPQLVNVLRGDMGFVGPRPERPRVYDLHCRHIRSYDSRFRVRPGLTGISQLLTPHGAPKRLRAWLDRRFIGRSPRLARDLGILLSTLAALGLRASRESLMAIRDEWRARCASGPRRDARWHGNLRLERRVAGRGLVVRVTRAGRTGGDEGARLVDINRKAMRILFDEPPVAGGALDLIVEAGHHDRERFKRIRCRAVVETRRDPGPGATPRDVVLSYEPVSPLHRYLFDRYVLRESLWPRT